MNKQLDVTALKTSMTSREVAELANKRHDHVLRDIENLVKTLPPDLGLGYKSTAYIDSTGKANRQFEMDRDSTDFNDLARLQLTRIACGACKY